MAKFEASYGIAEKVIIDGCDSIVAVVVQVCFCSEGAIYRISWVDDGRIINAEIEEWRLSKWEEE